MLKFKLERVNKKCKKRREDYYRKLGGTMVQTQEHGALSCGQMAFALVFDGWAKSKSHSVTSPAVLVKTPNSRLN